MRWRPSEEVPAPKRAIEKSLLQMLKTAEGFAVRRHKASAPLPSLRASFWQRHQVRGAHPPLNSGAENPHGWGDLPREPETALWHCRTSEAERPGERPTRERRSEEVLVPMRSAEETLLQASNTTDRSALMSWRSNKACLWQTRHVKGW